MQVNGSGQGLKQATMWRVKPGLGPQKDKTLAKLPKIRRLEIALTKNEQEVKRGGLVLILRSG